NIDTFWSIGETNALFVANLPYPFGVRQCRIAARRPPATINMLIARTTHCILTKNPAFISGWDFYGIKESDPLDLDKS
ncbi:MAG: hypothetical protein ACJA12_000648, partial [Glaciecola sp.]